MHSHIKQRLENIVDNLDQLPSLPNVVSKIINMVNDPNVDFKKVADEIVKDQAITANILKSIDRAIVILGIREVKDMVVLATTRAVLNKVIMGYDLARGELWKHGVAVAMVSKNIALMKKRRDISDEVFTGGIIHDVGKTVLALFVQNTFKDILTTVEEKNITFQEAEKQVMGFDHQEIGERVLEKWQFPPILRAIVRYHHEPQLAPKEYMTPVSIVHVANTLCLMAGIGIGSDGLFHELKPEAIDAAGLSEDELEKIYSEIPEVMQKAGEIM